MRVEKVPQVPHINTLVPQIDPARVPRISESMSPRKTQETRQSCANLTDVDQSLLVPQVPQIPETITATELMALTGLSRKGVKKRMASKGIEKQKKLATEGYRKGSENCEYLTELVFDCCLDIRDAWYAQNQLDINQTQEQEAAQEFQKQNLAAVSVLADWQRQNFDARQTVLNHIKREWTALELKSRSAAIDLFVADARRDVLPPDVQAALRIANARAGDSRVISRETLFRWFRDSETPGGLAPKPVVHQEPPWAKPLLKLYRQPQKPSLRRIVHYNLPRALAGTGIEPPTYDQARYYVATHVGAVERERGRMGPREIANIKGFRRRDTESLGAPLVAVTADGHTVDCEVEHPFKQRTWIRPEVTLVEDIYTRRIVGFSVWLAESALSVIMAYRDCLLNAGVPKIDYCDNGKGFNNVQMTALRERFGITKKNSIAYNSKARGIIERVNATVLVAAAKESPTYMGADMDKQAKQLAYKATRKGELRLPWMAFVSHVRESIEWYNNQLHSSLKGLSPNQKWQKAIDEGWKTTPVEADHLDGLLPTEEKGVRKCEITRKGRIYFSKELEDHHKKTVRVAYDPFDPTFIWVRELDGKFIGKAKLNGNVCDYFPKSDIELASQEHERAKARRKLNSIAEAQGVDLSGLTPFEMRDAIVTATAEPPISKPLGLTEKQDTIASALITAATAPKAEDTIARYERVKKSLATDPDQVSDEDREWLAYYETTDAGKFQIFLASQTIPLASNG